VTVFTPSVRATVNDVLAGWSAGGSYLVDIVSAASVDIVSTASPHWVEVRHAGALTASYEPGDLGGSIQASASLEPDYRSLSAGGSVRQSFLRKNVTLAGGYGYAHDTAGRSGTPFSVYSLVLERHTLAASAELVLDRSTILTMLADASYETGRQEKPYRYLPLFSADVADRIQPATSAAEVDTLRLPGRVSERLPDDRARFSLSARWARRGKASTFVASERLYADDWGLIGTTSDVRHVVDVSRRFSLWPHLRWHAQEGVSFWRRAYAGDIANGSVTVPSLRSGDRELGPLWSATGGGGVRWNLGAADPRSLGVVLELEATYTNYLDALYIDDRWAGLATLSAEVQL
jgi:hypothetical protein